MISSWFGTAIALLLGEGPKEAARKVAALEVPVHVDNDASR